jgi:hypothetical protein
MPNVFALSKFWSIELFVNDNIGKMFIITLFIRKTQPNSQ